MKQTLNQESFIQAFEDMFRAKQFSRRALISLYEYFDQYEHDTGEQIELDVIAICCEYTEETAAEIAASYSINIEGLDEDDVSNAVRTFLHENTLLVAEEDGVFVYQQF